MKHSPGLNHPNRSPEQVMADLLEDLPKDGPKFSLDTWYWCGTVACAVGHAALDPWFQRRGLRLDDPYKCPEFRGLRPWSSVEAFFDLDGVYAYWLFAAESYPIGRRGRREVIRRIRRFVKNGGEL